MISGKRFGIKGNFLDLFLALLVILAGLSLYFSFVRPLHFSHLIQREGVKRYAEIEILLPDDLYWMGESLPVGEESRDVYGYLDWKILEVKEETLSGKKMIQIRAKVLATEESSGPLRYGKYTLVKGGTVYLINDHYFLEGRIRDFRLLEEGIRL